MKKLPVLSALAVAVGLSGISTVQANNYQMLVPFPTNHALNDIAHLFVEMVDERFDGRYQISLVGEDAIPGFEQFDPVSSGVFPMALSTGPYHTGVTGVGLAADAIDADPEARRESGIWEAYQDYYLTHNVRMISFPSANPGYHFMLTDPIGDDGGFEGRIKNEQVMLRPWQDTRYVDGYRLLDRGAGPVRYLDHVLLRNNGALFFSQPYSVDQ